VSLPHSSSYRQSSRSHSAYTKISHVKYPYIQYYCYFSSLICTVDSKTSYLVENFGFLLFLQFSLISIRKGRKLLMCMPIKFKLFILRLIICFVSRTLAMGLFVKIIKSFSVTYYFCSFLECVCGLIECKPYTEIMFIVKKSQV
jgi:hypothetical protein